MEINGLPLHPLVVHAAVVFGPLAALAALAYVGLPRWRDRLRWVDPRSLVAGRRSARSGRPTSAARTSSTASRFAASRASRSRRSRHHEDRRRDRCGWMASGFAARHDRSRRGCTTRTGAVRIAARASLVVVGAVRTLVWTVLTGDAGARAVWG